MKNILAKAMTTYKEIEEPEEDRQVEPSLKDLQKEIQSIQMKQYHNNLCLKRIEQRWQTLMQSEAPELSAKVFALVDSSDEWSRSLVRQIVLLCWLAFTF